MGSLISIIVVIAVIVQVVKAINEQRTAASGDSKDSWWEEETPSAAPRQSPTSRPPAVPATAPAPRPTPSPHVQEILRHLQQQAQRAATPSVKPVAVVVPTPSPAPAPEASARRYLEEETVETELSHAAREATDRAVAEVYTKSVTAAFPLTRQITLRRHSGQRATIRVLSRNRKSLRQAILLGEVLGPPRAFDL